MLLDWLQYDWPKIATQPCRRSGCSLQQPWPGWTLQWQQQCRLPQVYGPRREFQVLLIKIFNSSWTQVQSGRLLCSAGTERSRVFWSNLEPCEAFYKPCKLVFCLCRAHPLCSNLQVQKSTCGRQHRWIMKTLSPQMDCIFVFTFHIKIITSA